MVLGSQKPLLSFLFVYFSLSLFFSFSILVHRLVGWFVMVGYFWFVCFEVGPCYVAQVGPQLIILNLLSAGMYTSQMIWESLCHFLPTFPWLSELWKQEKLIIQAECNQEVTAASAWQAGEDTVLGGQWGHGGDWRDYVCLTEWQAANQLLKQFPGGYTGTVLGPKDQSVCH